MTAFFNLLGVQSPAVKRLLGWRQGSEDDEWAEKAVECLVRKLKKYKGTIEELERALANPTAATNCVLIPRSLDGRLQICHKKAQPHVLSCRVWRWPDLQSHHELKPLPFCQYPFASKQERVCINPYHYERVQPQMPYGLLPPEFSPPPTGPFLNMFQFSPQPPTSLLGATRPTLDFMMDHSGQQHEIYALSPTHSQPSPSSSASIHHLPRNDPTLGSASAPVNMRVEDLEVTPCREDFSKKFWCTVQYHELNNPVGNSFRIGSKSVTIDGFTDPTDRKDRICLGVLVNLNRNSTIDNTRKHIGKGIKLQYDSEKGELHITCESSSPIFVQSYTCAEHYRFPDPTTVIKMDPKTMHVESKGSANKKATIVGFSRAEFDKMVNEAQAKGFESLYHMKEACAIRISFVKGWGSSYHRNDITMCPCWLQINLTVPMQMLDEKLKGLQSLDPIDSGTT